MTATQFDPGVIKDGNRGGAGRATAAQVHPEVSNIGLPHVEQVQPGFTPAQ
jgi:hypothetical protein